MKIGVLGIGRLAGFLVQGMARPGTRFLLSAEETALAEPLAARFGAEVAPSNQAVVDACDLVIACLPPSVARAALGRLHFREGQSVLSPVAGLSPGEAATLVAPARAHGTIMPGHSNALGSGPSLLCPPDPVWEELLSRTGPVHVIPDETLFSSICTFGGFSGATFEFLARIIGWFERRGLPPDEARRLVAETLKGNAEVILSDPKILPAICDGVRTPGGITQLCVETLDSQGALAAWDEALDAIHLRLTGKP